eukprot:scaffold30728_cov33-Prasinocladus_malaysianus.AAC.1
MEPTLTNEELVELPISAQTLPPSVLQPYQEPRKHPYRWEKTGPVRTESYKGKFRLVCLTYTRSHDKKGTPVTSTDVSADPRAKKAAVAFWRRGGHSAGCHADSHGLYETSNSALFDANTFRKVLEDFKVKKRTATAAEFDTEETAPAAARGKPLPSRTWIRRGVMEYARVVKHCSTRPRAPDGKFCAVGISQGSVEASGTADKIKQLEADIVARREHVRRLMHALMNQNFNQLFIPVEGIFAEEDLITSVSVDENTGVSTHVASPPVAITPFQRVRISQQCLVVAAFLRKLNIRDKASVDDLSKNKKGPDRNPEALKQAQEFAAEVQKELPDAPSARTIMTWHNQYIRENGKFFPHFSGRYESAWLLDSQDELITSLKKFMLDNLADLSAEKVANYLNQELLPGIPAGVLADYKITSPICVKTARQWMRKCGAGQAWFKAGYYNDHHCDASTVAYRESYVQQVIYISKLVDMCHSDMGRSTLLNMMTMNHQEYQLWTRMPLWARTTLETFETEINVGLSEEHGIPAATLNEWRQGVGLKRHQAPFNPAVDKAFLPEALQSDALSKAKELVGKVADHVNQTYGEPGQPLLSDLDLHGIETDADTRFPLPRESLEEIRRKYGRQPYHTDELGSMREELQKRMKVADLKSLLQQLNISRSGYNKEQMLAQLFNVSTEYETDLKTLSSVYFIFWKPDLEPPEPVDVLVSGGAFAASIASTGTSATPARSSSSPATARDPAAGDMNEFGDRDGDAAQEDVQPGHEVATEDSAAPKIHHMLHESHPAAPLPPLVYCYTDMSSGETLVEFLIDFVDIDRSRFPLGGEFSARFDYWRRPFPTCPNKIHQLGRCLCHMPAIGQGQDECAFKSHAKSKRCWVVGLDEGNYVQEMRKKGEGQSYMVSGFQDEARGFALPLRADELRLVNKLLELRPMDGVSSMTLSPGLETLQLGKNNEGYWTMDRMLQQLKAHLLCAEAVYLGFQMIYYFDWSSGHSAMPPRALHANALNSSWGGKQREMRSTKILAVEGFLGPHDHPGRLQVGDVQHMQFQEGDSPPWYAPQTKAEDYVGKPKGLKQLLWERGFLSNDTQLTLKEMRQTLANTTDFLHEETALEQVVHSAGHLLRMSPKGHPELAGMGIEYTWGKAKFYFRRNNDCSPKKFQSLVLKSLSTEVLPVERVRKFARRARDYVRAYATGSKHYGILEKVRKKFSTHRCAMDFDTCFIIEA